MPNYAGDDWGNDFDPSGDWGVGGPIIENNGLHIERDVEGYSTTEERWYAECGNFWATGRTPLIAAMRAYVASQLADY